MKRSVLWLLPFILSIVLWGSFSSVSFGFAFKIADNLNLMLSPGKLSKSHEYLETIKGCTECHELNQGVTDSLCLDCHLEIQKQIDKDEGFHAKRDNKECLQCHIEHNGLETKIIDLKQVEHDKFKLKLTGGHSGLKCEKCHDKKFINLEVKNLRIDKKRKEQATFLGLNADCESCHGKEHGKQFEKKQCTDCHSDSKWSVLAFDHQKDSKFKLEGIHEKINCKACHKPEKSNPKLVVYEGTKKKCGECHEDVHKKKNGSNCKLCHIPEKWSKIKDFKSLAKFDHSKRFYKIKGQHKKVKCIQCHKPKDKVVFEIKDYKLCNDCHEDPHKGQFEPRVCTDCHDLPKKWKDSKFDHDKADFVIEKLHKETKCEECHPKGLFVMPHRDDCAGCHSNIRDIMLGKSLEDNQAGPDAMYPDADCGTCHKQKDAALDYKKIRKRCVECHNENFGHLFDYRLKKFGERPKKQTKEQKTKRLKKAHRFSDALSK